MNVWSGNYILVEFNVLVKPPWVNKKKKKCISRNALKWSDFYVILHPRSITTVSFRDGCCMSKSFFSKIVVAFNGSLRWIYEFYIDFRKEALKGRNIETYLYECFLHVYLVKVLYNLQIFESKYFISYFSQRNRSHC